MKTHWVHLFIKYFSSFVAVKLPKKWGQSYVNKWLPSLFLPILLQRKMKSTLLGSYPQAWFFRDYSIQTDVGRSGNLCLCVCGGGGVSKGGTIIGMGTYAPPRPHAPTPPSLPLLLTSLLRNENMLIKNEAAWKKIIKHILIIIVLFRVLYWWQLQRRPAYWRLLLKHNKLSMDSIEKAPYRFPWSRRLAISKIWPYSGCTWT